MPLFVQNENEVQNEDDDSPLPTNTPSTGSIGQTHVRQCGNRVLEIIEKHRKEVQKRMSNRDNAFKDMLRRAQPKNERRNYLRQQFTPSLSEQDNSVLEEYETGPSSNSNDADTYNDSRLPTSPTQIRGAYDNPRISPQQANQTSSIRPELTPEPTQAKGHFSFTDHPMILDTESDEYFDLPAVGSSQQAQNVILPSSIDRFEREHIATNQRESINEESPIRTRSNVRFEDDTRGQAFVANNDLTQRHFASADHSIRFGQLRVDVDECLCHRDMRDSNYVNNNHLNNSSEKHYTPTRAFQNTSETIKSLSQSTPSQKSTPARQLGRSMGRESRVENDTGLNNRVEESNVAGSSVRSRDHDVSALRLRSGRDRISSTEVLRLHPSVSEDEFAAQHETNVEHITRVGLRGGFSMAYVREYLWQICATVVILLLMLGMLLITLDLKELKNPDSDDVKRMIPPTDERKKGYYYGPVV